MPDGSMTEQLATSSLSHGPFDISLVFAAREAAVRCALKSVRKSLRALSLDEMVIGSVEIVLAEALNNIVEHAYGNSEMGTITVNCQRRKGFLLFELTDRGVSFPQQLIPKKQIHDLDSGTDTLPEGGFGWGLIRDMTTSLAYRRHEGRNILRFSILSELS